MRGAARRRSTSEGEGERLSSTLNLPEAAQFNRFNPDRYASTPQINTKAVEGLILNPGSVLGRGVLRILST